MSRPRRWRRRLQSRQCVSCAKPALLNIAGTSAQGERSAVHSDTLHRGAVVGFEEGRGTECEQARDDDVGKRLQASHVLLDRTIVEAPRVLQVIFNVD